MKSILMNSMYIFSNVLGIVLIVYIISPVLPLKVKHKKVIRTFVDPLLEPIRFLLNYSAFKMINADISPFLCLVFIAYFRILFIK